MIPSRLIKSLATSANTAIDMVLRNGAPGQTTPTGEVGFVAAVTLGGVYDIAAAWTPILNPHGYSVKISGVFCHQSPKATFTDIHSNVVSCELADLLVVVEDHTGGSLGRRWAALVQAKMAAIGGGQKLTQPGDLRQLDLLTRWPSFSLPSNYTAGKRDFSTCSYAGSTLDCGRYGLIAKQPNPGWHQQAPAAAMPAGGDRLGTFLANMVEVGQVGYGREATGLGDDWSQTVDELMTRTHARFFNYASGFPGRQKRGHSALAMPAAVAPGPFSPFSYFYHGGMPPPSGGRPDGPTEEEPDEAISVLRIGIGRNE
ncbi:hypothetical protein [Mesorhizobium sp. CO1-1-4]|uniref:hypothetical protein n=1 Tax=Mesorhizobium sp. CO1-1-4 TaxID=2876633 RepID=UPI001CCBD317|nr:hypothetical protein [Mesorhizobium sp. CO1-1-4]MBZ9740684.1 hypothetical protein [Mesorhizobium sp. CO1-1-4]